MSDRQLLERAAAASGKDLAGYEWIDDPFYTGFQKRNYELDGWEIQTQEWNPLEDDSDALRLAVTLGLTVQICNLFNVTIVEYKIESLRVNHDNNPLAATRRAIVLAAASLCKEPITP